MAIPLARPDMTEADIQAAAWYWRLLLDLRV